jgi:alpha-galactosidase
MRHEWKIKYFKLDAIIWAALPFGHRYDEKKTAVEAYKMGMQTICDAVGEESFILGGNSPMWPSIGYINGMRVTNDNYRRWTQYKQLAIECFPRNWQHQRLWINDPDTILLQNRKIKAMAPDGSISYRDSELTSDEFAFNAVYTMACGGMVLSGDDVSELSDRNLEVLKRLTPPTNVAAIFDDNSWTIGRAKIDEMKTMIYIFNLKDEARDIEVPLDGIYHVYDILSETDLGICEGSLRMPAFRAHYAVALRLERCYPTL